MERLQVFSPCNQRLHRFIAIRDLEMAIASFTLGRLTEHVNLSPLLIRDQGKYRMCPDIMREHKGVLYHL